MGKRKHEEWRELEWGPYIVSSDGRIAKIRSPWVHSATGYARCQTVAHDGTNKATYAHQLVAEAFLGPIPDDCEIHHRNGDKSDNRAANLEYVTRAEHALVTNALGQHPRGETHHHARLSADEVREIRRKYAAGDVTQHALAREYGVSQPTIRNVVLRQTWRHIK